MQNRTQGGARKTKKMIWVRREEEMGGGWALALGLRNRVVDCLHHVLNSRLLHHRWHETGKGSWHSCSSLPSSAPLPAIDPALCMEVPLSADPASFRDRDPGQKAVTTVLWEAKTVARMEWFWPISTRRLSSKLWTQWNNHILSECRLFCCHHVTSRTSSCFQL